MEAEPGLTIGGYIMRPRSRGAVHAASADFRRQPAIMPNYLDHSADQHAIVAVLRWARRVIAQSALAHYVDHELMPGADLASDEALLAYARASGSTGFHQAGSCAMGVGLEAALDPELRVRGVGGLRVADASVMPLVVSGNPNASIVMIAEKASDMIRQAAIG